MRNADRRGFGDARAADRRILELDRADPLAARLDHVLGAVGEPQRIVGMDRRRCRRCRTNCPRRRILVLLEIARDDRRPARLQLARALAVAGQDVAVIVDDPKLDAEHRAAGPRHDRRSAPRRSSRPSWRRRADRADRRHLGHAPQMVDPDVRARGTSGSSPAAPTIRRR